MIKDKDNLLVENILFSDVIGDLGVDETPLNFFDGEIIRGLVERVCMKNSEWVWEFAEFNS